MKTILLFILLLLPISSIIQSQTGKDKWETYFEKSGFLSTPDYNETIEYLKRLAQASPYARLIKIGVSPQGRDLFCFIVSKDKSFIPAEARKLNKPVIMIQNGIHSGEIEGKDACLLLLREILITKEKSDWLDHVILLIVPVFNVDGHERTSPYNRINQNGPSNMGWRTTAQNLNLNRDYMKADAPEMRSFLKLYNSWLPDFFIDTHTTDGMDCQYSVTYAIEKNGNVPPGTESWIRNKYIPAIEKETAAAGFKILPYFDVRDHDLRKGLSDGVTTPMEPIAQKMADLNPSIKEEFMKKVESDEKFRESPRQRLNFFYQRSPYYDSRLNIYPVMRVE
jgi:hypothetical protein